jgi:mono/diheme cytochrome c family protein
MPLPAIRWAGLLLGVCLVLSGAMLRPAAAPQNAAESPWAAWVEPDFPFFSSVLDARKAGEGMPADNLTPRAIVLNLGGGYWAAFDTDLLRVAAIWQGSGVTPKGLAPGSYHHPDRKPAIGQVDLPEPDGYVWVANGIYPGWQVGAQVSFDDPREPAPSPEEVGRGPLAEEAGRFSAVRLVEDGVVLEYTVGGAPVKDWMTSRAHWVERHIEVGPSTGFLTLVLGVKAPDVMILPCRSASDVVPAVVPHDRAGAVHTIRVGPHTGTARFCVAYVERTSPRDPIPLEPQPIPSASPGARWPQEVTTPQRMSRAEGAFVVDDMALPLDNPWRRDVRPGDIQFLPDGTGVVVTVDGDVWKAAGLGEHRGPVRWRRFASGLHEPLTLAVREGGIYVFDRNGIWRLRDTDGNGEADVHELFSNAFAQTAETREFANTIRLAPGGEFVIAKGNQQTTTIGRHNGTVLRISADGRRSTVLGYGFRQPKLGVNVRTGLVTASDQQGHYVPATPLHIVRDNQFYGFLSDKLPREEYPAPVADPLTWIPHPVNPSAMSQVWMFDARMGPLDDRLVHIGYNNPEIFLVLPNDRGRVPQAAVVSVTRAFDFPLLNGSVNPADGQLYIAGFQVLGWGTSAKRFNGLGRVRYAGGASTLPREIVPTDKGVLLRFDEPLDPTVATSPDRYVLATWHYKRTYRYGSPQFQADGTPGTDLLAASAAYLSKDGRSVFVAVPGMTPVMQMRVGWSLSSAAGKAFQGDAYFTPYELPPFDPEADGFGPIAIDLTPRLAKAAASGPVSVEEGRRLFQAYGCVACHEIENPEITRLGPPLKGMFGRPREIAGGVLRVTADEAYIRESILEPAAKIVAGYESGGTGMPSYAGVLTDAQVESLVLFIRGLE